jgi:hypothetical protein
MSKQMKKSTEIVIFFNPKNKNKGDSPVFVLAPPKKKTPLLEVSFALFGGAAGVSPTGHRKIQIFHFPNSNMLFALFLMVDDDDGDDDDDVRWPKACLPASLMAKGRVMMMMVMKKPTNSMAKGLPANQFDGQKFASRTTLFGPPFFYT